MRTEWHYMCIISRCARWGKARLVVVGLAVLFAALLCSVATYIGFALHEIGLIEQKFARVHLGATERDVVRIMGPPDVTRGDRPDMPLLRWVPGNVELLESLSGKREAKQLIYSLDTPYLPILWVVGLDRQGIVVVKFKFR